MKNDGGRAATKVIEAGLFTAVDGRRQGQCSQLPLFELRNSIAQPLAALEELLRNPETRREKMSELIPITDAL